MKKFVDTIWNWGHLEGSHNAICKKDCKMTPEEFGKEYGINRSYIVSYGGNIVPPFDKYKDRFQSLSEIKWSVIGDSSSPLPTERLGFTDEIIKSKKSFPNLTGAIVDDFFNEDRVKRFTPEILKEIKKKLNDAGLDFWCVLYENQLDMDLEKYMDCFDGVSFWFWGCFPLNVIDEKLEKFYKIVKPHNKTMLGVYVYDYAGEKEMDMDFFKKQLHLYYEYVISKKAQGMVVCSSTLGDADLETNKVLKAFIKEKGNTVID